MISDITLLGWFHSIVGILAIASGVYSLGRYAIIDVNSMLGKFYIASTSVVCASSLLIYNATGSFNLAHILSVLVLGAFGFAYGINKYPITGWLTPYLHHLALSVTVYFSLLPTIAEFLTRLPLGDPIATGIEDPMIGSIYGYVTVGYGLFALLSIVRIRQLQSSL